MKNSELEQAIPLIQKLVWAERESRLKLQQTGVNVIPANFYSNTPSIEEVLNSYEYLESDPPYLGSGLFHESELRDELASLIKHSADFDPPTEGNEDHCDTYFWDNSQFSFSDAMAYYAYVRKLRPGSVVEIGSGFSTLIAAEALRRNGTGRLTCIEPFPRPFVTQMGNSGVLDLQVQKAQNTSAQELNSLLNDGDVLFIDSTHTVKSGSDCLHIYLRLLPFITKRIYVHVHDVFLPFGLPQTWLLDTQIYWTEQYLVLALLTDNPKTRVMFGSAYHQHFNPELLAQFMHGRRSPGGGSFWFEYDGRPNRT
jgi:hypothetical protein